jgi:hypothetical protein
MARGFRAPYTMEQMAPLLCCLELMELGLPTSTAARLVISEWHESLAAIFRLAERTVTREGGDVVLLLSNVHVMSGKWVPAPGFPGVPEITSCTLGELPGRVAKATKPPGEGRMLMTNLSALLRRFRAELANAPPDRRYNRGARKTSGGTNTAKGRSKPRARKRA